VTVGEGGARRSGRAAGPSAAFAREARGLPPYPLKITVTTSGDLDESYKFLHHGGDQVHIGQPGHRSGKMTRGHDLCSRSGFDTHDHQGRVLVRSPKGGLKRHRSSHPISSQHTRTHQPCLPHLFSTCNADQAAAH
jgi:hypothetical protein